MVTSLGQSLATPGLSPKFYIILCIHLNPDTAVTCLIQPPDRLDPVGDRIRQVPLYIIYIYIVTGNDILMKIEQHMTLCMTW